jgi:hypothetical protein
LNDKRDKENINWQPKKHIAPIRCNGIQKRILERVINKEKNTVVEGFHEN